jgi:hypothetical protein
MNKHKLLLAGIAYVDESWQISGIWHGLPADMAESDNISTSGYSMNHYLLNQTA